MADLPGAWAGRLAEADQNRLGFSSGAGREDRAEGTGDPVCLSGLRYDAIGVAHGLV